MRPLYGFLEGDTIGLLTFAYPEDTVAEIASKLQRAADVRVGKRAGAQVVYRGQILNPALTVAQAGFEALDRFEVVFEKGEWPTAG